MSIERAYVVSFLFLFCLFLRCCVMTRKYESEKRNGFLRFSCKVYDHKSYCGEFTYYVNNGVPDLICYNKGLLVPAYMYELRLFVSRASMAANSPDLSGLIENLNDNDNSLVY